MMMQWPMDIHTTTVKNDGGIDVFEMQIALAAGGSTGGAGSAGASNNSSTRQ